MKIKKGEEIMKIIMDNGKEYNNVKLINSRNIHSSKKTLLNLLFDEDFIDIESDDKQRVLIWVKKISTIEY